MQSCRLLDYLKSRKKLPLCDNKKRGQFLRLRHKGKNQHGFYPFWGSFYYQNTTLKKAIKNTYYYCYQCPVDRSVLKKNVFGSAKALPLSG